MSQVDKSVISPRLRKLLVVLFFLFAILFVDSVYLSSVTLLEWSEGIAESDNTGQISEPKANYQGEFYQYAFLAHLVLGFVVIIPTIIFIAIHLRKAINRPNRLAVKLGLLLFVVVIMLLVSGILLTRGLPGFEIQHPSKRLLIYWTHVITPVLACWLFVMHRLAGPRIRWKVGGVVASLSLAISLGVFIFADAPMKPAPEGNFLPSLARTDTGRIISSDALMRDEYCATCHSDIHSQWAVSAHRFSSFNNPAYLFSVRNTRNAAFLNDGDVQASRFCAGCHDPVPLFSGAFDEVDFDDENHPTAHAGITCVSCHAIEQLGSPRGNADYVISAPEEYPFAFSENKYLAFVNGLLIKGKPQLHKESFLKPLHKTSEFCGTCHKVHIPEALNKYKWLRGQNHYDSFLLSGVSGHGVQSFYYPDRAVDNCAECHMPLLNSEDFGAAINDESNLLTVHGHQFPAANTAIPFLLGMSKEVNRAHEKMLKDSLRVDIFGIRGGVDIDAPIVAPIRPEVPSLKPGEIYVLDIVVRSLTVGHLFTEGTADSNQVWLEVIATQDDEIIGNSGLIDVKDGRLDPLSHFINAYVLDRDGNRIDRRNAEDIFTKLYDHQIPPGSSDTIHYRLEIPEASKGDISVTARLKYRKFDTKYLKAFQGEEFTTNDLPIVTIAEDSVEFSAKKIPAGERLWQRWNDYGIGMLRKGAFRQAEVAFQKVRELGRPEGPLNLSRLYIKEGRLEEAALFLNEAAQKGAYPWSVAWFSALVDMQNGEFDAAIEGLQMLVRTQFNDARQRGFDFSLDYRLQNQLAQAFFEKSKTDKRNEIWRDKAEAHYMATLALDPENVVAHYGLSQLYALEGSNDLATKHRKLHKEYRVDDNARDLAITKARRNDPAANNAAESIVIYDLRRRHYGE
ncbi:MAG: multiheme c-type cytochrome [Pseudomonadota bacterium]|nr:multiheme c-type cytochrome [Pseudomonadota bacterium]